MSPDEAPAYTLCSVGHPSNGIVIRKGADGFWYFLHTGARVEDVDAFKMTRALWIP